MSAFRTVCRAIIIAVMVCAMASTAYAGTGMVYRNSEGDVFCTQTGWVRAGDDLYYVHKTEGTAYKKGEACRNDFRWKGNKLYFFGSNGKALKKSVGCVRLGKDGSVALVVVPGTKGHRRYNVSEKRYQEYVNGTWWDVGMQTDIPWMCDWQK